MCRIDLLIVYGADVKEIARHELYPSGVTGQNHSLPQHAPARDQQHKRELLRQRFEEFGTVGILFFDGLLGARRNGKDEAGGFWDSLRCTAARI